MKTKKFLSPAEISEIRELRENGSSAAELADAYGVARTTIYRVLACQPPPESVSGPADTPAPPAEEIAPAASQGETKVCPHCGEVLPERARFCFMCGKVPKTEREIIIERVTNLASAFRFAPENIRDEVIATINATVAFLKTGA